MIRSLGQGLGDLKEHHILNRTLRWCRDGLVFAADVRHAKEVIEEFESTGSKPLSSPVAADSSLLPPSVTCKQRKVLGGTKRKVPVAWQGFPVCDPRPGVLLCYADGRGATDQVSRRSTSGTWWWRSHLLGEEATERRALELGGCAVFSSHGVHALARDSE